jgi:transposase
MRIAPERLLRALLLQVLYTVRSERQLMESRRRIPRPGLCGARGSRLGWPTRAMC